MSREDRRARAQVRRACFQEFRAVRKEQPDLKGDELKDAVFERVIVREDLPEEEFDWPALIEIIIKFIMALISMLS